MTEARKITPTTIVLVVGALALAGLGVWLIGKPRDPDSFKTWAVFGTLALMALGWLADFRKWVTSGKVVTAALVILAVVAMAAEVGGPTRALINKDRINAWNAFHYVLGTKYFGEIGYHDSITAELNAAGDDKVAGFQAISDDMDAILAS